MSSDIRKPSYNLPQNLLYLMKHMWKYNRNIFLFTSISVLSGVMISVLGVYLPKITLDGIEQEWKSSTLLMVIGVISITIAILNFVQVRTEAEFSVIQDINRNHFIHEVEKIVMSCAYSKVEDPAIQVKMEQAAGIVYTGNVKVGLNGLAIGSKNMLNQILSFVVFSFILVTLNPFILGILIITSFSGSVIANKVAVYEHRNRDKWAGIDKKISYIHRNLTDNAKGKDIRVYSCVDWFKRVLDEQIVERFIWLKRVMNQQFGKQAFDIFMLLIQNGLALGWISYSVLNGQISLGDFMLYFGAISQFSGYVNRMMNGLTDLKKSSLDMCILRDFLEMEKETEGGEDISLLEMKDIPPSITFEHVSFHYPNQEKEILSDINFTVKKGEKIALVGSNGAGKTTLIKMLCGFYQPTKGRILINDISLDKWNRKKAYQLYSAVFQDIMILPFSVAQNVAMVKEDKIDKERVRKCLEIAGLKERLPDIEEKMVKAAYENGIELSGGESQKLLLARAIYKDAPILVLDEPTAALDPIAESKLYLQYNELTERKTSIFISHRLASTYFCDRILFLEKGKIAEMGSHEELMNQNGSYAQMFEIQSSYYQGGVEKNG